MAKSIIKELIIVLLLCLAIILVLGILLYEYVPVSKTIPNEVSYTTPEEVKEAKKGIQLLGGQIESTHDFTLANHDDFRSNIIIKKVKETPKKYPRMFSKIKKSPL